MAMLDRYDISNLPAPMSRGEKLLYKIAVGETDLSDVPGYLSRHEELLKYLIENGEISEDDFEYVLHTLNQSSHTLYLTAEKPVKSAILKGSTKYRDIDTGDILDTFDETKNLELVSVKMPVLKTVGKNLWNFESSIRAGVISFTDVDLELGTYYFSLDVDETFTTSPVVAFVTSTDEIVAYGYADSVNKYEITKDVSYITLYSNGFSYNNSHGNITTFSNMFLTKEEHIRSEYEPYKSNILTVNKDVELRGIGDVQDTLDYSTGEVTESIVEIVLDGTQYMDADGRGIYIQIDDMKKVEDYRAIITCDKLPVFNHQWDLPNVENGITGYLDEENKYPGQNWLYIKVNNSIDVGEVRQILTQNPITFQYQRVADSIKTVDLTVVDQDNQPTELGTFENVTHVSLEAENLIPEVEMEVATRISEELASASPLMEDISTKQERLNTTIDEQSENVDATMIATTEIFEETL